MHKMKITNIFPGKRREAPITNSSMYNSYDGSKTVLIYEQFFSADTFIFLSASNGTNLLSVGTHC